MKSNSFQTIYVMWLREMKRLLRAKSRILSILAMPLFFLVSLGFGFRGNISLEGVAQEIDYINFLAPGLIGMTLLFSSMSSGISVLWDKEFGFLKEIMVAPVKRWIVILGRIAGGTTIAFIQGILVLITSLFMGLRIMNITGLFSAFLFMILISVGFLSLGVAIASVVEDLHAFPLIMRFITFPTFLLSGAFFPVTSFPKLLRFLSYINPLTYGVDALRGSLIGFSQFPLFLNLGNLLIFGLIMLALSSYLFSKTEV
jgi:ABC-2 type transport system permease protein